MWVPDSKSWRVCVPETSPVCLFAGSTALDLRNMERRRRWGGRLADSPDGPMLRNKGGGAKGDRGFHLFTRLLEHYICSSLLLPLFEVPAEVIRSVPMFKLPVSGRLGHSTLLQVEVDGRLCLMVLDGVKQFTW